MAGDAPLHAAFTPVLHAYMATHTVYYLHVVPVLTCTTYS